MYKIRTSNDDELFPISVFIIKHYCLCVCLSVRFRRGKATEPIWKRKTVICSTTQRNFQKQYLTCRQSGNKMATIINIKIEALLTYGQRSKKIPWLKSYFRLGPFQESSKPCEPIKPTCHSLFKKETGAPRPRGAQPRDPAAWSAEIAKCGGGTIKYATPWQRGAQHRCPLGAKRPDKHFARLSIFHKMPVY